MNKRLIFLLLAGALGIAVPAEVDAGAPTSKRPAVTMWPVGVRFVRLSKANHGEEIADEAWVDAPVSVVEGAKQFLAGTPKAWHIQPLDDYEGSGKRVVIIDDSVGHVLVCLANRDQWIRLNDEGGIPSINELLSARWNDKLTTADVSKQKLYTQALWFLFAGPDHMPLSHETWELMRKHPGASDILLGTEKRESELAKFCVDPVITQHGRDVELVFNVMTGKGAIERWTVHGWENTEFTVRDIAVETIKREGSFIYSVTD